MTNAKPKDFDEYIARFPIEVGAILESIRLTVKRLAPDAQETISYGIPTFNLNGTYLIYFAAHKHHIALYPMPSDITVVGPEFAKFKTSGKGTIQFPLDKPIPMNLITKLVKFKLKENVTRSQLKTGKRKNSKF